MSKSTGRFAVLLCTSLVLFTLQTIRAADIIWTNTAGGAWDVAANWSPNQVPAGADTAWITNAGVYTVTNSTTIVVGGLNLGASSGTQILRLTTGTMTVTNTSARNNTIISLVGGSLTAAGPLNSAGQINQSGLTLWLLSSATLGNYNLTNGELRGGTLTVTNFNWMDGNLNSDVAGDKTIIPLGGVLNFLGNNDRFLSYYTGTGRGLDNHGTWNWIGSGSLRGQNAATVNNHGSVIVTATNGASTQFNWAGTGAAPVWNNFGSFTRHTGTSFFYFNNCYFNNPGLVTISSGAFSIYNSIAVNDGAINVNGDQLQFLGSFATNNGTINMAEGRLLTVESGTLALNGPSSLTSPTHNSVRFIGGSVHLSTTNFITPSVWIAGAELYQRTNIVVSQINQSAGAFQLVTPGFLDNYNLTNGELRGRNLTVTNFNWMLGNLNNAAPGEAAPPVPDKLIIPAGGVLNFLGNTERYLSYWVGNQGRGIDNHGTWNWIGSALLRGNGGAVVNNHGTVIVTAVDGPNTQFLYGGSGGVAPTWNNFGSFTRMTGTSVFYFNNAYLNNSGLINILSGSLAIHAAMATNLPAGIIQMAAGTTFLNENGAGTTFLPNSRLVSPDVDSVRLPSGSIYMGTTNVATPTMLLTGGVLYQQTNFAVAAINQSAGALDIRTPAAVETYNLTGGELRGRDLMVTNFNWTLGNLNNGAPSDPAPVVPDRLIIPVGGVLNFIGNSERFLSYWAGRGRGLDNHGTWNWMGNGNLRGNNFATVNNHGDVIVTASGGADPQFNYGGSGGVAPVWNNFGTFQRTTGSTIFYFNNVYLNNSGTVDIETGTLSFYASTVTNHTGGVIDLAPNVPLLNENGAGTTLEPGSLLTSPSPDAFRIASGTVYLRSAGVSVPSILISGGTLRQETNAVSANINQSAGVWHLAAPASVNTYNFTNGELRGADLTINTFNWLGGSLNADGPGSNTVTVTTAMDIRTATAKALSYYVQPGRSLISHGTATWGGASITGQGGATIRNHGTLTLTNDAGLAWGGSGAAPILDNKGIFAKSGGSGASPFSSATISNTSAFSINSGSINFGSFFQTSGNAFLNTNFASSSTVQILAGSFAGQGSVAGVLYNNGVLSPGASPGFISAASFTNSPTAVLNVELGATNAPGTNYDQVRVSGLATLGGTMNVTLANNFAPELSNTFTVMTYGSRSGTFPTIVPPPGVTLDAVYTNTALILTVTGLTNAPLQITSFPSNQTVYSGDPASFFVGVSGTTPITYQWQFNSNNVVGATNSLYSLASTFVTNSGTYSVLITDGVGATTNASAVLTVLPFDGTIYWTNIAGGNWSAPSNWIPHRVPGPTNTAAIISNGNYMVTIDVNSTARNLIVGSPNPASTQTVHLLSTSTLVLGGNSSWRSNTLFHMNGVLQTEGGSNYFGGQIQWQTGTLLGAGRSVIGSNANLHFVGSLNAKYVVTNVLENYGSWTYGNDSFGNSQMLQFSGGAHLTNYASGVINIGTAALTYSGSQTPRSYLVNYGTINTLSGGVFSPSYLSLDFINHGLLDNFGYTYISRGTNFGEFRNNSGLAEISIFGDPNSNEYFSFELGTTLSGATVNIACGGPVQWKARNTVHNGSLRISSGSGGASYPNAEFKILANYTNTGSLSINRGLLTMPDPSVITDLNSYADSFVSFWSFFVTNAGTWYVNNMSHIIYGIANGGSIVIRTNGSLAANASIYGGGSMAFLPSATVTFSGNFNVDNQRVENHGGTIIGGGIHLTGGAYFENKSNATIYFNGGSVGTGPATLANYGAMSGFGGSGLGTTNFGFVTADDPLGRTLTMSVYKQLAGTTEVLRGQLNGNLQILGGLLTGTNVITGSVYNAAHTFPGKPFGPLYITGNYTNTAAGLQTMAIGGVNSYPTVHVSGNANLAGTFNVVFTNGFFPVLGNTFTAMTYTARSGQFDNVVLPNYQFEVIYTTNALLLLASNALPVINLSVVETQLVCTPFGIQASATDPDGSVTNIAILVNGSPIITSGGTSVGTMTEIDFPQFLTVTARAIDNRGGTNSTTQIVNMTTLPLHTLMLGGFRSNSVFKLCMLGQPGSNYTVMLNTNMRFFTNWTNIGLMTHSNGIWRYFDTNTTNFQRYYRARLVP
jgi:hypothetical protein